VSHITPLKRGGGYNFDIICRMCNDNGWQIMEKKTFKAYQADQACDFAIKVPGAEYEIGVVQGADGYEMKFDTWYRGGLAPYIGEAGTVLEDNYNIANTKMTAEYYGHSWQECMSEDGKRQVAITLKEEFGSETY